MMSGTAIVPTGSMCRSGLRLTRPCAYAVMSPKWRATKPCAASCSVMANSTGRAYRANVWRRWVTSIFLPSSLSDGLHLERRERALSDARDERLLAGEIDHGARLDAAGAGV